MTNLPGVFLTHVRPHTPKLLQDTGRFLGIMDKALAGFSHPDSCRDLQWDLRNAAGVIEHCKAYIEEPKKQSTIEHYLNLFVEKGLPLFPRLRVSIIHNDANDHNILVSKPAWDRGTPVERSIAGIIDFGDMLCSFSAGIRSHALSAWLCWMY